MYEEICFYDVSRNYLRHTTHTDTESIYCQALLYNHRLKKKHQKDTEKSLRFNDKLNEYIYQTNQVRSSHGHSLNSTERYGASL